MIVKQCFIDTHKFYYVIKATSLRNRIKSVRVRSWPVVNSVEQFNVKILIFISDIFWYYLQKNSNL